MKAIKISPRVTVAIITRKSAMGFSCKSDFLFTVIKFGFIGISILK